MSLKMPEAEERDRIEALCDDNQTVHSITRTSSPNKARAFYCVVRTWPHPEESDLEILCIQNAQLTASWADMSDTWLSGSYRQRIKAGDGDGPRQFAQDLAATAARLDAEAYGRPADYTDLEAEGGN